MLQLRQRSRPHRRLSTRKNLRPQTLLNFDAIETCVRFSLILVKRLRCGKFFKQLDCIKIIPGETGTLSASETASLEVDEAGVISEKDEAATEEGSEEEPSTFKSTYFSAGMSKCCCALEHYCPLNETRQVI